MKVIILATVLFMAGCSNAFDIGDCVIADFGSEKWEDDWPYGPYKILEKGKKAYRVKFVNGSLENHSLSYMSAFMIYEKVDCDAE